MKYCVQCKHQKFNGAIHYCYHHSLAQDHPVTGPNIKGRPCDEMRNNPSLCGKDGVLFSEFTPPPIPPLVKFEKILDFFFWHPIFSILTGIALATGIIGALITILK